MEHPEGDTQSVPETTDEIRPAALKEFEPTAPAAEARGIELLSDLTLPVTVELGRVTMRIRDLLCTGPGAVISLDRGVNEPVDILAGDRLIARGEVVVVGQSIGVRVTELVHGPDKEVDREEPGEPEATATE